MKLGVTFNLFDGYELLPYVLENARKYCDYCCLVVQEVSNAGNKTNLNELYPILGRMKPLIDASIKYEPCLNVHPHMNEIEKRNIGLQYCKSNGCTHGISADVDEFYDPSQVEKAREIIEKEDYDSSSCKLITYYKNSNTIFDPLEEYFVPFIYKLDERKISITNNWNIVVDPTRKMEKNKIKIFDRSELQMHHLSYVRKDLYSKLANSSARQNFGSDECVRVISDYFNSWKEGMPARVAGAPTTDKALKKIENTFLPFIQF